MFSYVSDDDVDDWVSECRFRCDDDEEDIVDEDDLL